MSRSGPPTGGRGSRKSSVRRKDSRWPPLRSRHGLPSNRAICRGEQWHVRRCGEGSSPYTNQDSEPTGVVTPKGRSWENSKVSKWSITTVSSSREPAEGPRLQQQGVAAETGGEPGDGGGRAAQRARDL